MLRHRKLADLTPLENNPRVIKDHQFEKLVASIVDNPEYFEARPVILSDRTGDLVILAGNQRYKAAKHLGLKTVPTYLISGLSEDEEREIIIRDNVSNGEWDMDLLKSDWDIADLEQWGVEGLNFEEEEVPEDEPEPEKKTISKTLIVECRTAQRLEDLHDELMDRGFDVKLK